jgi:hypothetical protein
MRNFLFIVIIATMGCAEKDPLPTLDELLHGVWVRYGPDVNTNLNFHSGACDVCAMKVYPPKCWDYAYTTDGDVLTMIDLVSLKKAVYVVAFPTDSTAVLSEIGGGNYHITRVQ